MKIAILIPSRNRPRMLSAVITTLHEMESGENQVEYLVGYDDDDLLTPDAIPNRINATGHEVPPDIITIGGIWNYLATKIDASIYSCMIDDAFPISPHWDKEMVRLASQYQAFSWYEVSAPHNCGYPTCTIGWLHKVGYIVPEHFPFWFCDTWFSEMVQFITAQGVPVSTQMSLFSKQEATQNMRQLSHWWGVFNATRTIRLRQSFSLLDCSWSDFLESRKPFIDAASSRDVEFYGERIDCLEKERGVKGEPSERYIEAFKNSEKYLLANNLTLWQNLGGVKL